MKFSLQNAAFLALFIAKASAAGSGIFAANGVELEVRNFDSDTMIGEPVGDLLLWKAWAYQLTFS